ncbi:hypothetical protein Tcan_07119 [Toxocara canis]|uniref:Uncharacterized protein n=1 Tax=Toxocara canis TaxID=6265 RepID=A0A0B2VG83_TOXCA|nr:hypothetical protein Tcan_07119 [Toxocara canis]
MDGRTEEDQCVAVKVRENEFSGLIGNLAGNLIRDKVGGGAGQLLGGLADNVFGGEGEVKVRENEFSGLIGNLAGNLIRDKVGGGAGQFLGGLADNVFGGEG